MHLLVQMVCNNYKENVITKEVAAILEDKTKHTDERTDKSINQSIHKQPLPGVISILNFERCTHKEPGFRGILKNQKF